MNTLNSLGASLAGLVLLSACGGGSGGSVSFSDFANINTATDLNEFTPNATVNSKTDRLSYSGFVNIVPDAGGTLVGYIGNLNVSVDFAADTIDGSAQNFGEYTSATPGGSLPAVAGSLDIEGTLTAFNEVDLGDGMIGTATGTIDEYDFDMTFNGNVLGATRSGVVLYFDNVADLGGGVGIATR